MEKSKSSIYNSQSQISKSNNRRNPRISKASSAQTFKTPEELWTSYYIKRRKSMSHRENKKAAQLRRKFFLEKQAEKKRKSISSDLKSVTNNLLIIF